MINTAMGRSIIRTSKSFAPITWDVAELAVVEDGGGLSNSDTYMKARAKGNQAPKVTSLDYSLL